jgi:hypothetical protein
MNRPDEQEEGRLQSVTATHLSLGFPADRTEDRVVAVPDGGDPMGRESKVLGNLSGHRMGHGHDTGGRPGDPSQQDPEDPTLPKRL